MSKRGQKTVNQSKVFVSFGDVSGRPADTYDKKNVGSSVPLYTGDDNDLASVSKKVMKKDPTTKLKAMQELGDILQSKPEHTIAEFLSFYVHCYSKLCLEDTRSIREKLCSSIDAITSVEKRLLAPHMKNLIGPWWMLTGDPAPEVAEKAYGSFCNAIPPKKRQQVLLHLSSAILSEAVRNLQQRPETLSDMSVATFQEAEERLERVLVSTLASIGKFVSLLTLEQNLSLCVVLESESDEPTGVRYRDFFNDSLWLKCLGSKYAPVRKAAYQLLDTVLTHIPVVLRVTDDDSSAVSTVFCTQFVKCLLEESHFPNMAFLVNSFVLVVKHLKAFLSQVSVHDGVVPVMHRLMKSHPQLTLEFLLPIAGCLPAESVALLEASPQDTMREKGLDAICDFLRSLTDYADAQAAEGLQDTLVSAPGKRKRLEDHKQALLRGQKAECAVNSMRTDVCVVELATLLLLRRSHSSAAEGSSQGASASVRVQDVVAQLVQSVVLTMQSAAIAIRSELAKADTKAGPVTKGGQLRKALSAAVRDGPQVDTNVAICDAARHALQAVSKSLVQLQRATVLGIHLSSSEWTSLLWEPLGESVLDLLVAATGEAAADRSDETPQELAVDADSVVETMAGSLASIDAIVKTLAPAWSEKVENAPSTSSVGAHSLASVLMGHVQASLGTEATAAASLTSDAHAIMQSQLLLAMCDRSWGLLGRTVTLPATLELLVAAWWKHVLPWLAAPGKKAHVVATLFACGLADVAAFLSLSSPSTKAIAACSRLASYCTEASSVEGASIVCRHLNKSAELSRGAWTADVREWVSSTGAGFLASGSVTASTPLHLHFLLIFSSCPAMADVPAAWMEQVRSSWSDSRVTIRELFQLTLLAASLDPRGGSGPVAAVKDAMTAWARDDQQQLHDCLTKLFFARIRTRDYKTSSKAHAAAEFAPLNEVVFVTSWAEVQEFLLPVLPAEEKLALQDSIAAVLNASLLRDPNDGTDVFADDDVDGEGEGPVSPAKVREGQRSDLAPRKWVRHFRGLIAVSAATSAPEEDLASPWKLLRVDYWADRLAALLNEASNLSGELRAAQFALECFELLLADEAMRDPAVLAHLREQPIVLLWILLVAEQSRRATAQLSGRQRRDGDSLELQIELFVADLPSSNKSSFYSTALSATFAPESVLTARVQELRLSVVRRLLASHLPATFEGRESIKLQSPTIRRDERVALGAAGMYLSWKPVATAAAESSTSLMRVTPIPCKLAAVHKEAGAEPYFTITMDLTGDVNLAHELQVEWPKLVMGRNFAPGAADLVKTLKPAVSEPVCKTESSNADDSLLKSLMCWLEDTFAELFVSPASPATTSSARVDLYLAVLRQALAAVTQESKERRDSFEERVVAPARGAVLYLLSPSCACADMPHAQHTSMLLLQALLSAEAGTGCGLWLPAALSHLRRIVSELCGAEASPLLGTALDTMALLLQSVPQWELCAEAAEQLLSPALAALSSPVRELSPKIMGLLHAAWQHRSEQRAAKADLPVLSTLAAWEVEGFDFALFTLVEGITGSADAVRFEACAALHFCLLKRSRRACQELFAASLMGTFAERLQKIVCGDFSSSVVKALQTEECRHTVRLTSCKLLDAWEASRREENTANATATKAEPANSAPTEELSLQEEEVRELEQDGELLAEVVGAVYTNEMNRLFRVTEADLNNAAAAASQSAVQDEPDEEDPAQDATDRLAADNVSEVAESEQASESQFSTKTSGSSRTISKRNTLRVMTERDPLGCVLLWLLVLQRVDARAVEGWTVRARCVNFLKKTGMATNVMFLLVKLSGDLLRFRDVSALLQRVEAIHGVSVQANSEGRRRQQEQALPPGSTGTIAVGTLQHLATYALFRTVCTLPAMFRTFWSDDCNRVQKTNLSKFIEDRVRNSLVSREISLIALSSAAGRWDPEEFAVRGSAVSGEVTAVLTREETTIEIKVKLPPSYPLKNVDVTCTSRIGVSDGRWRRWVLQIIQLLSMQDGSVVDAVLMWKVNIEKELEGVEPCPICYCTLHTKTLCLPTLACPTCNNKFHQPCLHTWFRSSGKSKCVICQQPFPR